MPARRLVPVAVSEIASGTPASATARLTSVMAPAVTAATRKNRSHPTRVTYQAGSAAAARNTAVSNSANSGRSARGQTAAAHSSVRVRHTVDGSASARITPLECTMSMPTGPIHSAALTTHSSGDKPSTGDMPINDILRCATTSAAPRLIADNRSRYRSRRRSSGRGVSFVSSSVLIRRSFAPACRRQIRSR
jgi:hypothetical protein